MEVGCVTYFWGDTTSHEQTLLSMRKRQRK